MLLMNESIGGTATYLFTLMNHIDSRKFNILIVCNNMEFCKLAEEKGFSAFVLEKAGRGRYLRAIRCVASLIEDNSIDILNIHDGGTVSFIGRAAALLTGIISVSTIHIHAGDWGDRKSWSVIKERFLERITRGMVKKFIAVSRSRKIELMQKGIRSKDIVVIQNGVDIEAFDQDAQDRAFRKELAVNSSVTVIAQIAHLGVEKGYHCFLEAAKMVLAHSSDVCFVIVGDGYLRQELTDKSRALGINGHVVFTGFRTDISDIMNSIDILVLASLNEGLPMVLLEAMAAAKPVVSTKAGGIPEAVLDGKTGYLVEPGDSQQLARSIMNLKNDPDRLKQFSKAGLERVKKKFSARRMAEETGQLYETLIQR